jgi:predicted permease
MNDLRYALRMLCKNSGYTAVAVLTLALGIGATTAIVSVVRATLWAPLPVPHPERLVQMWAVHRRDGYRTPGMSPRAIEQLRQQTHLFQRVVVYEMDGQRLAGDGLPERIRGAWVSPDFFSLLNARPERGRGFTAEEARPGYGDVVILSHALWQSRFGGDPAIVGRSIRFLEGSLTVVGVMPASFAFPASSTRYWRPLAAPPAEDSILQDVVNMSVIGELRENAQLRQVEAFLELLQRRLANDRPSDYAEFRFEAMAMRDNFATLFLRRTFWVLFGAIALVLLIASGNLANLQSVRIESRQRELAVRAALGGLVGMAGAILGTRLLRSFLFGVTPQDPVTLIGVVLLLSVVAVLACWWPARHATRVDPMVALKCE